VVLFLHGTEGTADEAEFGALRELAEQATVISFDRPGHGLSVPADGYPTPEREAEVIIAALTSLGIDRVTAVGHSWGALPGLAMAEIAPERLERLVLLSGFIYPAKKGKLNLLRPPVLEGVYAAGLRLFRHAVIEIANRRAFSPHKPDREFLSSAHRTWLRTYPICRAVVRELRYMPSRDREMPRPPLRVPTVAVCGETDKMFNAREHARRLKQEVDGELDIKILGDSHDPHHVKLHEVAEILTARLPEPPTENYPLLQAFQAKATDPPHLKWLADGVEQGTSPAAAWVTRGGHRLFAGAPVPLTPPEPGAIYVDLSEGQARQLKAEGRHRVLPVGGLPLWNPESYKPTDSLQKLARRALTKSVEIERWSGRLSLEQVRRLQATTDAWLAGRTPLRYLTEPIDPYRLGPRELLVARQRDAVVGFLSVAAIPPSGLATVEQITRKPSAPTGTMEALILEFFDWAKEKGAIQATLGLAPFQHCFVDPKALPQPWRGVVKAIQADRLPGYRFSGLNRFKAKFGPGRWEPRYLACPNDMRWMKLARLLHAAFYG
jgi:pimeloyl-ACP methyl ester carboxylesterase